MKSVLVVVVVESKAVLSSSLTPCIRLERMLGVYKKRGKAPTPRALYDQNRKSLRAGGEGKLVLLGVALHADKIGFLSVCGLHGGGCGALGSRCREDLEFHHKESFKGPTTRRP